MPLTWLRNRAEDIWREILAGFIRRKTGFGLKWRLRRKTHNSMTFVGEKEDLGEFEQFYLNVQPASIKTGGLWSANSEMRKLRTLVI